jgi:hypothetical protein
MKVVNKYNQEVKRIQVVHVLISIGMALFYPQNRIAYFSSLSATVVGQPIGVIFPTTRFLRPPRPRHRRHSYPRKSRHQCESRIVHRPNNDHSVRFYFPPLVPPIGTKERFDSGMSFPAQVHP